MAYTYSSYNKHSSRRLASKLARKNGIINKISSDTANLNTIRRDRLKLVWVNNNKMINKLEEINQNNKKKYLKLKKTVKEYSKDF